MAKGFSFSFIVAASFAALALCHAAIPTAAEEDLGSPQRIPLPQGFGASIYLPANSSAKYLPTIVFVGGAGALLPASTYSQLLELIAAFDFIVVGLDRRAPINYLKSGRELSEILSWTEIGGLADLMSKTPGGPLPDVGRIAVMGQSSGNHIIGEALVGACGPAKAWVMIDPVDGFDPYRFVKSQDLITPGRKLNVTIPSLMLNNGLDPERVKLPTFPACAPAELSNDRFYLAMRGPAWAINATDYGHTDCQNKPAPICPTNPATDKDAYKSMLARASATFLQALFGIRSKQDLKKLEDPGSFNVSVILKHDLKGLSLEQVEAGCKNADAGEQILV